MGLFCGLLVSCATGGQDTDVDQGLSENQRLDKFFAKTFDFWVQRSPEWQSYLGIKDDNDRLDDISDEKSQEDLEITKKHLEELEDFDYAKLDEFHRMSYDIFKQRSENAIKDHKYRYHYYPLNQMFGLQSNFPSFMMNIHQVSNVKDAKAYISRLKHFKTKVSQLLENMNKSQAMGIIPPKFVYPHVIRDSQNVIKGVPFVNSDKDSPMFADFKKKLKTLKVPTKNQAELIREAREVFVSHVKPSYEKIISFMTKQEKLADTRAGAWKLPDGEDYYRTRLERYTTTKMSADEIHSLGLKEVQRIHKEMNKIKKQVGFKGSLDEFFNFIKTDKQFFYPDSEEGRKTYLGETNKLIAGIKKRLPEMFNLKAKAKLVVKPVESFREKSAGRAFYQGPPMKGDRPGIYYVNLYDLRRVAKYEMEALAYHEALPGHHMQISIATEQEALPKFRRYAGFTAYTEGWGLYAEYLPKEYGFYKDPYADFGRLSMELWRACRLVVDTGLHYKKWTREQAIDYLNKNTPTDLLENTKAVERYIVMPGQATSYKVGMLKILQLREWSKKMLGHKFDIRDFHDKVLGGGALPLNLLEKVVATWVNQQLPLDKRPASL